MKQRSTWIALFLAFGGGSVLTSCQSPPAAMPGSPIEPSATGLAAARGSSLGSTMRGTLLYVATGDNVYILSYPRGKLISSLGIPGYNLWSDAKRGRFRPHNWVSDRGVLARWYVDTQSLADADTPLACAVDPTTGNLAVTNEGSGAGEIAIYPNAQGTAQMVPGRRDCNVSL